MLALILCMFLSTWRPPLHSFVLFNNDCQNCDFFDIQYVFLIALFTLIRQMFTSRRGDTYYNTNVCAYSTNGIFVCIFKQDPFTNNLLEGCQHSPNQCFTYLCIPYLRMSLDILISYVFVTSNPSERYFNFYITLPKKVKTIIIFGLVYYKS